MVRKRRTEYGETSASQGTRGGSGRAMPRYPPESVSSEQQRGHGQGRGWITTNPQYSQPGHGELGSSYQGRGSSQSRGSTAQQQPRGPIPGYEGYGSPQPRGRIPPLQQYERRGSGSMASGRVVGTSAAGSSRPLPPDLHQASSQASSSRQLEESSVSQQFQQLAVVDDIPSQAMEAVVPVAPSSKSLRFPLRPGKGNSGVKCVVKANHFFAELPDKDLHQFDVSF